MTSWKFLPNSPCHPLPFECGKGVARPLFGIFFSSFYCLPQTFAPFTLSWSIVLGRPDKEETFHIHIISTPSLVCSEKPFNRANCCTNSFVNILIRNVTPLTQTDTVAKCCPLISELSWNPAEQWTPSQIQWMIGWGIVWCPEVMFFQSSFVICKALVCTFPSSIAYSTFIVLRCKTGSSSLSRLFSVTTPGKLLVL